MNEENKSNILLTNNSITKYKPSGSWINKNTVDKILHDSKALYQEIRKDLDVVNTIPEFEQNTLTKGAKPFAECIENCALELAGSRSQMRECWQLIFAIQDYRPAIIDNNAQPLWNAIDEGTNNIKDATFMVMNVGAEFTHRYLILFNNSIQHFITSQSVDQNCSLRYSLKYLIKDVKDFTGFKDKFIKTLNSFRNCSLNVLYQVIKNTPGAKEFRTNQEKLPEYETKLLDTLSQLRNKELQRDEVLHMIRIEIADLKGKQVMLNVQKNYAQGMVNNFTEAMEKAQKKADKFREQADNATNSSTIKESYLSSHNQTRCHMQRNESVSKSFWGFFKKTKVSYTPIYTTHKVYEWKTKDKTVHHYTKDKLVNTSKQYENNVNNTNLKLSKETLNLAKISGELNTMQSSISENQLLLSQKQQQWNKEINDIKQKVDECKADYDKVYQAIQDTVKKSGVCQDNVADFLQLTLQLIPSTLNNVNNINILEYALGGFADLMERKCLTTNETPSIEKYFTAANQNLTQFIEPLKKEDFISMDDLTCDTTEDYEEILSVLTNDGSKKITRGMKKKLKKICYKWKEDTETEERVNKAVLVGQMPVLGIFFSIIQKRLNYACKQLCIETNSHPMTNKNLQIGQKDINELD